jgi:hypothetical protein
VPMSGHDLLPPHRLRTSYCRRDSSSIQLLRQPIAGTPARYPLSLRRRLSSTIRTPPPMHQSHSPDLSPAAYRQSESPSRMCSRVLPHRPITACHVPPCKERVRFGNQFGWTASSSNSSHVMPDCPHHGNNPMAGQEQEEMK